MEIKEAKGLKTQLETEIRLYLTGFVPLSPNNNYSQARLINRISLFENHIYPTGKFTKRKEYKYWFDIISPRIDAEVKNIDFDTRDVFIYSPRKGDDFPDVIMNLKNKEYMRGSGQSEEINSAVEEGSGWGNVLWKKIKGGYERCDLKNTYIINQTAENIDQTPVIERHQYSHSDLIEKSGVWANLKDVIRDCKSKTYKESIDVQGQQTTVPYYAIYERNGEVSLKDLKEAKGEEVQDGDEDIFVLARVIGAGLQDDQKGVTIKYIVFADTLKGKMSDYYKEFHRSRYKGRWFREGLYELLFDIQTRINKIGNQISQGLSFASKVIFYSQDKLIVQNILTDMNNGDIIRAQAIQQVNVRMEGFDQLANEWNRLIQLANDIANSREIVTGESLPSGTPFQLGRLLNTNANKLFEFIREKLAIPFTQMFEQWIIPDLISELKSQDVVRLTGDSTMMQRLYEMIAHDWYIRNLLAFPPHDVEAAQVFENAKIEELKKKPQILIENIKAAFDGYKPHAQVVITGENATLAEDLQTIGSFIALETDPVRRTALIEMAMRKKGIDVGSLPKSTPQLPPASPVVGAPAQPVTAQ